MKLKNLLGGTVLMLCLPVAAMAGNGVFTGNSDDWYLNEQWSNYPANSGTCEYDGFIFGTWQAGFDGGGCTTIVTGPTLQLEGTASTSSLVHSTFNQGDPTAGGDIYLEVKLKTISVLAGSSQTCIYGGSPGGPGPCTYNVGWVLWNGRFDTGCSCYTFNYFLVKPTIGSHTGGWELGVDYNNNGYDSAGGTQTQNIIATGSGNYATNTLYDIEITHSNSSQNNYGDVVTVTVNGTQVVSQTDPHTCDGASGDPPAYTYGAVYETNCFFRAGWAAGVYEEGAQVNFPYIYATRL